MRTLMCVCVFIHIESHTHTHTHSGRHRLYVGRLMYSVTFASLFGADSKTLKEEKREELFESLKANGSIGWAVDVIDPRELSAKMLKK